MSLDKAIKYGKEKRKGYRERGLSGEHDITCRNHGSCSYCERRRRIGEKRLETKSILEEQSIGWNYDMGPPKDS